MAVVSKDLLASLCRAGAVLLGLLLAACAPEPPDLVLVTFDTLRVDHVGAYVPRAEGSLTPHFDALAAHARVFEHALTTMPTTAPAHASLLTGLYPREHGVERNGDRIAPEVVGQLLQQRLREQGYATGAFVTAAVFGDTMGIESFDRWNAPPRGHQPGVLSADAALAWIDEAKRPFFLWLHLYDAHSPYGDAKHKARGPVDLQRYGWVDRSLYASPDARAAMEDLYGGGVRDADAALGRLLDGLRERGLDPFVAVTADHGELLSGQLDTLGFAYGHGSLLTQDALGVPLLLAGPGVEPGRVSTAVSLRDLYTTFLATAGIDDGAAAGAGRFDLRGPLPAKRVVVASRRVFEPRDRSARGLDPKTLATMQAHAVAASDGSQLLVLGRDGSPLPGAPVDPTLQAAAAAALEADLAARAARTPRQLDPALRERLKALGYVD